MIIMVSELKKQINCGDTADDVIKTKLDAIEAVIRAYTNNNFQNRGIRVQADIKGGVLMSESLIPFDVGDTVQISACRLNNGLFTVSGVSGGTTFTVNENIKEEDCVLVTKIEYPADVIQCAVDLYDWKQKRGDKVGVKSETISRHSVTYEDSATLFMGYPVGILNGLKLHKKARC